MQRSAASVEHAASFGLRARARGLALPRRLLMRSGSIACVPVSATCTLGVLRPGITPDILTTMDVGQPRVHTCGFLCLTLAVLPGGCLCRAVPSFPCGLKPPTPTCYRVARCFLHSLSVKLSLVPVQIHPPWVLGHIQFPSGLKRCFQTSLRTCPWSVLTSRPLPPCFRPNLHLSSPSMAAFPWSSACACPPALRASEPLALSVPLARARGRAHRG